MHYKSEKIIKLAAPSKDRRRKLTDNQQDEIVALKGTMSQRECARKFNVSRRTIQFIWDPDKHKHNLQCRQERGGSRQYYTKEKNREYMKRHRHYKQDLFLSSKE